MVFDFDLAAVDVVDVDALDVDLVDSLAAVEAVDVEAFHVVLVVVNPSTVSSSNDCFCVNGSSLGLARRRLLRLAGVAMLKRWPSV
jgi:hypothetical protein